MMIRPDYRRATNVAYKVLSQEKNISLPIDIWKIVHRFKKLKVISYSHMAQRFGLTFLEFLNTVESEYGYLQRDLNDLSKAFIVYNDKKDATTIRFTVAHEFSHYLLGHILDDCISDKEANCCARNILCPVPIVDGLKAINEYDYMRFFAISQPMAAACVELKKSDSYYISFDFYLRIRETVFDLTPLEKSHASYAGAHVSV